MDARDGLDDAKPVRIRVTSMITNRVKRKSSAGFSGRNLSARNSSAVVKAVAHRENA